MKDKEIRCTFCGHIFKFNIDDMKSVEYIGIGFVPFYEDYIECPKCNKRNYVHGGFI